MAQPLVSILVPCCNAAPWLERALSSVVEQSWESWELIVVDDGSTDGSEKIAARFASNRCQVFRQENQGASPTRNRAFASAQGDFIQYLDADDFLDPHKIALQMEKAQECEVHTLTFASVIHLLDSTETGSRHLEFARLPHENCYHPIEFLTELWMGRAMVQTGQWLMPRKLMEQAGPWNEQLTVDDDGEFFTRVVLAAKEVMPVPEACYFYRKFNDGRNLSAAASRHFKFQQSAMISAQLKAAHLLERTDDPRARSAAARLVTDQVVESHPAQPELGETGLKFLQERGLTFALPLVGPPWFLSLYPMVGWRAARRLQQHAQNWRAAFPIDHSQPITPTSADVVASPQSYQADFSPRLG